MKTLARLTDEQLEVLERATNAASPGPWRAIHGVGSDNLHMSDVVQDLPGQLRDEQQFIAEVSSMGVISGANADFIALARETVPALIEELRRWRAMAE